jgi:iron complex outermembrane receptor protein
MASKEPNRVDYETSVSEKPKYETLRDLEVGYQHRHKIFTLSTNVFWMDYTNQLVQTGKLNDVGAYTRVNTPSSYRVGIEIDGAVNILKNLKFSANFTFSQNKIKNFTEFIDNYDTGIQDEVQHGTTDISFSPDFIGGFTLTYSPVKNLEMDVTGKYVSRQFLDNTSNDQRSLDPYFTNDFRIRYNIAIKQLFTIGFNVIVNNFTNRLYEPNGYSFSYTYGGALTTENWYYPQAGINVMGGITLRFEKKGGF